LDRELPNRWVGRRADRMASPLSRSHSLWLLVVGIFEGLHSETARHWHAEKNNWGRNSCCSSVHE
jgi:hypothetical protein